MGEKFLMFDFIPDSSSESLLLGGEVDGRKILDEISYYQLYV